MNITRAAINPLITPNDVIPSSPELKVVCAFNAAATQYRGETILLLRVAEAIRNMPHDEIAVPILQCNEQGSCVLIERIPRDTPGLDISDSRIVVMHDRFLLTSLSHLRLARSTDGVHFTIDSTPTIFPESPYEEYGIEDSRITRIDDVYYINYSAVSRWGIGVGLASTTDFKTFARHGLIFGPENKNVAIFPEKINGQYYALHRPSGLAMGNMGIWMATSPDLRHWGNHRTLVARRSGMWDSSRIGAGSVPFKTDAGWLAIYHGVNSEYGYCLGAMLLDKDDPSHVLARSTEPILYPQAPYECTGFFGNVVFTCGSVLDDQGIVHIYYGAADEHTCLASVRLQELLDHLEDCSC